MENEDAIIMEVMEWTLDELEKEAGDLRTHLTGVDLTPKSEAQDSSSQFSLLVGPGHTSSVPPSPVASADSPAATAAASHLVDPAADSSSDFFCSVCHKSAHCHVCSLSFSSHVQHQEHNEGRKHKAMVQQMKESGGALLPPIQKPFVCTICSRNYHCVTCNKSFCSQVQMEDHLNGRKHKKLKMKLDSQLKKGGSHTATPAAPTATTTPSGPPGNGSTSQPTRAILSVDPQAQPLLMSPAAAASSGRSAVSVASRASNTSSTSQAHLPPSQFMPFKKSSPQSSLMAPAIPELYCEVCDAQLTSVKQKEEHDRGRKHLLLVNHRQALRNGSLPPEEVPPMLSPQFTMSPHYGAQAMRGGAAPRGGGGRGQRLPSARSGFNGGPSPHALAMINFPATPPYLPQFSPPADSMVMYDGSLPAQYFNFAPSYPTIYPDHDWPESVNLVAPHPPPPQPKGEAPFSPLPSPAAVPGPYGLFSPPFPAFEAPMPTSYSDDMELIDRIVGVSNILSPDMSRGRKHLSTGTNSNGHTVINIAGASAGAALPTGVLAMNGVLSAPHLSSPMIANASADLAPTGAVSNANTGSGNGNGNGAASPAVPLDRKTPTVMNGFHSYAPPASSPLSSPPNQQLSSSAAPFVVKSPLAAMPFSASVTPGAGSGPSSPALSAPSANSPTATAAATSVSTPEPAAVGPPRPETYADKIRKAAMRTRA